METFIFSKSERSESTYTETHARCYSWSWITSSTNQSSCFFLYSNLVIVDGLIGGRQFSGRAFPGVEGEQHCRFTLISPVAFGVPTSERVGRRGNNILSSATGPPHPLVHNAMSSVVTRRKPSSVCDGVWHVLCRVCCVICWQDHKPSREDETERIKRAGGMVIQRRVMGELAVSRAFGDRAFKVGIKVRHNNVAAAK